MMSRRNREQSESLSTRFTGMWTSARPRLACPLSAGRLPLGRDDAQLLQHPQLIHLDPMLDDLAVLDPVDLDPTDRDRLAGRRDPHHLPPMRSVVLVYSNPRGSSSYGRDFTMRVTEDWGGEDYKDLMAVMDKVCELPYVDAKRTGVAGYSYGGYMTSWIIGQTDRFQACVCGAPCFDLESMYGTSDISHTFGEQQWGGAPHVSKEWYAAHSPSTNAHRAVTPTLIVHGESDERCPIGQGEQMFVALKKANCEVEFARYPGGSHSFPRIGPAEHREDYLTRSLAWFKDHLGEPV
jgi:dipeptidyl aminopeptidase/acylaminoacyl peptidase